MKRLYLLRHATALPPENMQDKERRLAPSGLEDAKALGALMMDKNYIPDYVLCSPATRTLETYDSLDCAVKNESIDKPEQLYNGGAGDILSAIQNSSDSKNAILVVGHNPGIHELALRLCDEDTSRHLDRLMMGYKPGSLSVFDCPVQVWNDIQLSQNTLLDLQEPLDYNAPNRPTRWM